VQIVNTLTVTHSAAGSAMPADKLPGAILDAIRICKYESQSIESAMEDQLSSP